MKVDTHKSVGVIMGLMKGFVKRMASIVGLIAGLLMARALFGIVAERLAPVLGVQRKKHEMEL